MDILSKTLSQMPESFSSNEFAIQAKKNGISKRQIANGIIASYLNINATKGNSRRMWIKTSTSRSTVSPDIEYCIARLKELGYKVLKPINQWEEI
jgi:hypothetical protein